MKFHNYSSLHNVTCLSLKGATATDLEHWFKKNPKKEIIKQYINQIILNNNKEKYDYEKIVRIYIQENFVFATEYSNYNYSLIIDTSFMNELKTLPAITNPEVFLTIQKFMDNLMQNHNMEMNEYLFMELFKYQESYFENNDYNPFFLNQTIVISIPEYGLTLYEILGPNKYKPVFSELKQSYPDRKINKNFIVQKMYYHKQLPIAFSAKLNDTDIEKWFWSDQFELALRFIEPETLTIPKCALTIDAILDKINEYGIVNLSDEELNFLQHNK